MECLKCAGSWGLLMLLSSGLGSLVSSDAFCFFQDFIQICLRPELQRGIEFPCSLPYPILVIISSLYWNEPVLVYCQSYCTQNSFLFHNFSQNPSYFFKTWNFIDWFCVCVCVCIIFVCICWVPGITTMPPSFVQVSLPTKPSHWPHDSTLPLILY